jgi:hypothetical protein
MTRKLPGILIIFLVAAFGLYSLWQYGIEAATTIGGIEPPTFQADLKNTLDLQAGEGKPTFTRASIATVTDFEGLIRPVKAGEARFEGARRVENLIGTPISEQNGGTASYSASNNNTLTISTTGAGQYPRIQTGTINAIAGQKFRVSFVLTSLSGSFGNNSVEGVGTGSPVTDSYIPWSTMVVGKRYSAISTMTSAGTFAFKIGSTMGVSTGAGSAVISDMMVEEVTGQANQNPSEYVSTGVLSAPYHGTGADGVQYFTTTNGNTVASNVVTEAAGPAIPDATLRGYVAEVGRTNLALQSETLGTTWTPSNITVTSNSIVSPSGATTADTLTATAGNATLLQSITSASATRDFSIWLKRKTGTGNIDLTMDNGATWTTKTITSSWERYSITQTAVTNPIIGVRIVTDGDEVYAWGAQLESGTPATFASSYIPTTAASVTRAADALTYPVENVSGTKGTASVEIQSRWTVSTAVNKVILGNNAGNGFLHQANVAATSIRFSDGTVDTVKSGLSDTSTGIRKRAISWGGSVKKVTGDGLTPTSGTFNGGMTMTGLGIGNSANGAYQYDGTIRNVKIWKKALTDGQLSRLTSVNNTISNAAIKKTTVGSDNPSFQADLKNTLDLQAGVGKPTFTRADGADRRATVTDFEGLIKPVKSGEARFEGARRVENLVLKSDNPNLVGTAGGSTPPTITTASFASRTVEAVTFAAGVTSYGVSHRAGGTISIQGFINSFGRTMIANVDKITYSCKIGFSRALTSGEVINVTVTGSSGVNSALSINSSSVANRTNTLTRISQTSTFAVSVAGVEGFYIYSNGSALSAPLTVYIADFQVEDVTGQANQNPSEYVSTGVLTTAPYHGANVDGVKYFTTQNGNTVAGNVVTEATGSAIPDATLHGYLAEGARINKFLQSETLGTSWTASNITVGDNSVVAPSGVIAAETLIASADNGTLLQAITGTAASYTMSVYLKRFTGTGEVSISADGTNFTACTITSSTWTRCTDTRTLTAASYNGTIKLATNTDTVYAWGAQIEAGAFASSYIPTTAASVTRAADSLTYPSSGNVQVLNPYSVYLESALHEAPSIVAYRAALGSNQNYVPTMYLTQVSETGNNVRFVSSSGYGSGAKFAMADETKTSMHKYAGRMDGTNTTIFANGSRGTEVAKGTQIEITTLNIGSTMGPGNWLYGTVRNVKIWKKALTDAQLINLTSTNAAVSQSAVKKVTVNASQNTKQTNGLVGLWSFNGPDVVGTAAYDRSGQNNHGTLTNGPTKTIGKVGQALAFDGVDDYINIPWGWAATGNPFTVSAWVKDTGDLTNDVIFDASAGRVSMQITAANLGCLTNNDSWKSGGSISANTWTHVVCVFDGTNSNGYINGSNVFSLADNAPAADPTVIAINSNTGHNPLYFFPGFIDEVRLYNRALTQSEVLRLYNQGR